MSITLLLVSYDILVYLPEWNFHVIFFVIFVNISNKII